MTTNYPVIENSNFVGRLTEKARLATIEQSPDPCILIIYGRRRVGKTELIEQFFAGRNLIKLEGLENEPEDVQIQNVLYQLSRYLEDPYVTKLGLKTWVEVLDFIADKFNQDTLTLYFEEVQWIANYGHHFISALKYVWDNRFRHHKKLKIILCGSAPSFMIQQVLHSKALYNRSTHEMCLNEFTLKETQQFLKTRSEREVMTAHLTLGGIPEYLKQISGSSSVLLGICENSFVPKGYFTTEHKRIFISSMANNPHYKLIIEFLSEARFATRNEIRDKLEISSGGSLTEVLNDLEMSGFIEKYVPYQAEEVSTLARYCIRDAYLMFYFKFIRPLEKNIRDGVFAQNPLSGLNMESYQKWMGYSFERFIRRNHFLIAKILGFSGVRYRSGVFYNRGTQTENAGYQIDLIFDRDDNVITVCEVRFYSDAVDTSVISELEAKLKLHPNPKNHTIQKILITTVGITQALQERNYFDKVITLTDLFHDRYWL